MEQISLARTISEQPIFTLSPITYFNGIIQDSPRDEYSDIIEVRNKIGERYTNLSHIYTQGIFSIVTEIDSKKNKSKLKSFTSSKQNEAFPSKN